jgi:hypothetical protein
MKRDRVEHYLMGLGTGIVIGIRLSLAPLGRSEREFSLTLLCIVWVVMLLVDLGLKMHADAMRKEWLMRTLDPESADVQASSKGRNRWIASFPTTSTSG